MIACNISLKRFHWQTFQFYSGCFNCLEMFKFNFNIDENDDQTSKSQIEAEEIEVSAGDEPISTVEPEAGKQTYEQLENLRSTRKKDLVFKDFYLDEEKTTSVEYLANVEMAISEESNEDREKNRLAEINRTHDVVAGEYEGGLKIWELSIDLARLIYNEPSVTVGLNLAERKNELRVLEVGCGHSLPSLSLLKLIERIGSGSNFKIVLYLQDFNKNVKKFLNLFLI